MDAKRLGQCNDRAIHEAKAKIREAPVHLHRTGQLTDCRRRVREGASCEILHEHVHRRTLVAQEAVELGQDEAWHISCTRLIDRSAKKLVIRGARDEVRFAAWDDDGTARAPARGAVE
jgi:hypothetical protein